MKQNFIAVLLIIFGIYALNTSAQTPNIGITANLALGEVTEINAANNQMQLNTKDGAIAVVLNDKVEFKRVSPDKPTDLSAAVPSNLTDINVGDRVVVQGKVAEDKKTIAARRVILMTKADIAKKQETDREKWTVRGVAGRVTAINPAANEITVATRGPMGAERNVIIATNEKTSFRRYAPGSVKFSEAKTSNLNEIKTGDQLRAHGEKSADGARVTADEIVSGSFRMIAGKITAIDAANNEVTIKDTNNKDVKITVNSDTLLRRFPAEMAERMAQFQSSRASVQLPPGMAAQNAGAGLTTTGGNAPAQPNANPGANASSGQRQPGAQGGMMRAGRGDLDEMLERLPTLALTDLKAGDAIAVLSGTDNSSTNDRVAAIKFVAGVEPFLKAPVSPNGAGAQGNRPAQSAPSFNIPGLDSIGTP